MAACAGGWFAHPATTTASAVAADDQCTPSETPWEIESPNLRPAFRASAASVGIDRRWFVTFGRDCRTPGETRITQRRQAAKERVLIFAALRLCVSSFQQVRQRTCRAATSGANPRKQRSDEFRWAQFECTNRSRDVRRWHSRNQWRRDGPRIARMTRMDLLRRNWRSLAA